MFRIPMISIPWFKGSPSEELKKQMENSDMLMITEEEWNDDMTGFKHAFFHWNKLLLRSRKTKM